MNTPFKLDTFQEKAIEHIQADRSVLVSAPTGAGKTVIAEHAIEQARKQGGGVIYTAPIKTLSNQKYRDFLAAYPGEVGIVTGDVSINPDASIVIMTTEIYRNSLFENSARVKKTSWVIFDEIHYLNDPERGTVWEEAILFTPPHIKILALSATVPNVHELSDWIKESLNHPIEVIIEKHRPVPLHFAYLCQGKIMFKKEQLLKDGYLNQTNWRQRSNRHRRRIPMPKVKPFHLIHLLNYLKRNKQLPCIYFAFGRKRTEALAFEAMEINFLNESERRETLAFYDKLIHRYQLQEELSANDMRELIAKGIGFHHAGMLPSLKEVIEQMFTHKLLKLIFTTETFALGINMPARCVVFDDLQKYYGNGFKNLTTRDFYQMAGRAGRRGLDSEGHVYMRVNPRYIGYHDVQRMLYGKTEPILSQFNAAYATLLNLFQTMGYDLVKIYPDSLHYYQASKKRRKEAHRLIERKLNLLHEMGYIDEKQLTQKGEFATCLFGYEFILSELHEKGDLESLKPEQLCVLLSSLVFEPRKNSQLPRSSPFIRKLEHKMQNIYRNIHRREVKFKVMPHTRPPHFHIANAMSAWAQGETFNNLFRFTDADEGELIRNFRMVIQLLRELSHAPHTSEQLVKTTRQALQAINRDIIDAEKQLRA